MDAIFAKTEARRQDLIGLTQDLISIPALNPPGQNCRSICDTIAARLQSSGFATEFIRAHGTPGYSDQDPRRNLITLLENGPGDCVHFNSHHDVVAAGHGWPRDNFGGVLDGDRIYGRGACDMKGGLAAGFVAAEAFLAATPDWHGSIEIPAS